MPGQRIEAFITPALMMWARERAGLSPEEAARRFGKTADVLQAWEDGAKRPTMNQARDLALLYGQPLGVFYLEQPPKEPPPPTDYRGRGTIEGYSPELLAQIRRAHALRDAAVDLAEEDDHPFPPIPVRAKLGDAPAAVAARIRAWLGAPVGLPKPWASAAEAFKWWRAQIEHRGVLVFIIRKIDQQDMSGFTLAFDTAPVVGINGSDGSSRKLFSLLHEIAHVALRTDGVSAIEGGFDVPSSSAKIEIFCNAVAAHALLPTDDIRRHPLVAERAAAHGRAWTDEDIRTIAGDFGVSQEVAYLRMIDIGVADRAAYARWRRLLSSPKPEPEGRRKGGPDYYRLKIHDLGLPYLQRVFDAYHSKTITLADVCGYLGVRADTAHKLEAKVGQVVGAQDGFQIRG